MAQVDTRSHRCAFCWEQDCSLAAHSVEYDEIWLLIPYPLSSTSQFWKKSSLRRTCGHAILHETYHFCTPSERPYYMGLRMPTCAIRSLYYRRESTSCINGGNILHALLHNFGKIHPGEIQSLLVARVVPETKSASFVLLMLLQRDLFGNLPIHLASSLGVPTHLLNYLLRKTLDAQKSWYTGSVAHSNAPFILSTNKKGYSLIDIELIRYIECDPHVVHSAGPCYRSTEWLCAKSTYYGILQDAMDQIHTDCGGMSEPYCPNDASAGPLWRSGVYRTQLYPFLGRIKSIIVAAYEELQRYLRLDQRGCIHRRLRSCSCFWLTCFQHNVSLLMDWCPFSVRERICSIHIFDSRVHHPELFDDAYVLHYASALSGPIVMVQNSDQGIRNGYDFAHKTASRLLQVSRPILRLLLWEYDPLRASNLPHPTTGKIPLHFAVQSNLALGRTHSQHCMIHCGIDEPCETSVRKESIDEWHDWIRELITVDPAMCCAKDFAKRIPLHYALLRSFRRYSCCSLCCTSELGGDLLVGDICCGSVCAVTVEEEDRNRLVLLLVRFCPESIEIPCPIRFRELADLDVEGEDIGSRSCETVMSYHYYSCFFQVYQVAAMAYPVVSLNSLYTILRMCPSRCYSGISTTAR